MIGTFGWPFCCSWRDVATCGNQLRKLATQHEIVYDLILDTIQI